MLYLFVRYVLLVINTFAINQINRGKETKRQSYIAEPVSHCSICFRIKEDATPLYLKVVVAGIAGFEPTITESKSVAFTFWLYPYIYKADLNREFERFNLFSN